MTAQIAALVVAGIPILGTLIGLLMWNKPESLKAWLLIVAIASLGAIVWASGHLLSPPGKLFLLFLLPLMAFVTLLGQPVHAGQAHAWLLTLVLLGLGLGVLASEAPVSPIFFLFLLAVVALMLFRDRSQSADAWWGIGALVFGMIGVAVALVASPPVSVVAFALACATALPLAPFHKGYVAALTRLPGNLPAFLALLFPVMGFHGLIAVLPQFPDVLSNMVKWLALVGMLYASLKALTQFRAASVIAYGGLAFLSMLWWYLSTAGSSAPQIVVYLSAVSLAGSGLLLAWFMLRARYGEMGLRALSGLAQPMPRFAIVVSLLALAGLGLPPFGVFSGFMGLLLAPSFTWTSGLLVVVLTWLSASWYLFELVQGLLFGRRQTERRHEDLRDPELTSLVIVLALLVALGVLPSRLFGLGTSEGAIQRTAVVEFSAWTK